MIASIVLALVSVIALCCEDDMKPQHRIVCLIYLAVAMATWAGWIP